jgi:hypothetical protein
MAARRLQSRDWRGALLSDHSDTLATRDDLASWLGRAVLVEEAVTRFRQLATDQTRVQVDTRTNSLKTWVCAPWTQTSYPQYTLRLTGRSWLRSHEGSGSIRNDSVARGSRTDFLSKT